MVKYDSKMLLHVDTDFFYPYPAGPAWAFLGCLRPGGWGAESARGPYLQCKTIKHIGMKLRGVAENHKLILKFDIV